MCQANSSLFSQVTFHVPYPNSLQTTPLPCRSHRTVRRCYLTYALSLRDLEEMMTECGILVDHSTLYRWIIRLTPLLHKTFRRYKQAVYSMADG